jgi:insulysin
VEPGEHVIDAAEIAGVNTAFTRDYLLPDDSPTTRAAALVIANFFSDRFYTELRTKQQLGYIVGSAAGASLRHRYFTFIVQSSGYPPDELRRRAEEFIATLPDEFAKVSEEEWNTLVAGARSQFEEKPKSMREKAEIFFARAYTHSGEWNRQQASLAALDQLTKEQAVAFFRSALAPDTGRQRTILLSTKAHPPAGPLAPTFTQRDAWKRQRQYQ